MVNFPIALLFFSVGGFNLIQTRKKRYRYLKLMSPLHAAIYTTISYTLWVDYYLKKYYLTLRSKVKVPRMSLWYETHRLMVMDLPTKYYWPISKDKNVMARTRKYYLKTIMWPWWQRSRSHKGHYGMRHTALWSCTHIFEWYYLKHNYFTLRSKVNVPRRSLWYMTDRLMVMHPHTKYHCPIS